MKFINWIKSLFAPSKAEGVQAPLTKTPVNVSSSSTTAYEWAMTQLGVKEIKGYKHDKQIQKYLATVNLGGYSDETAWCAAFVNWCLAQAGIYGSDKPNARSFLKVGRQVGRPEKGDVVIFWRESKNSWKGHVAFFVEYTPHGQVVVLGGNQGNCVCYKTYSADRVLGFRRFA